MGQSHTFHTPSCLYMSVLCIGCSGGDWWDRFGCTLSTHPDQSPTHHGAAPVDALKSQTTDVLYRDFYVLIY